MKNILKLAFILFIAVGIKTNAQILKPGDGINLTFFNIEEKITGKYFIQENGKIQLPYLGLINTVNKDFSDIRNEIIAKYTKIYRNPELNVQPLYRVAILGEVGKPGIYYTNGFESFTDILAKAGGETNDADLDGIYVVRNNTKLNIDLTDIFEKGNSLQDIGIRSGDKIYVPRAWWVTARDGSVIVSGIAVLVAIAGLFTK